MEYRISVIVPALNEGDNIGYVLTSTINTFVKLDIKGEIIVINDGSTDHTPDVTNDFIKENHFIRMISHEKPKGAGASYWEGVQASKGENVIWIPGDGEINAYEFLRYLNLLDHVDIVIGYVFNRDVRNFYRRFLSSAFNTIMNYSFSMSLKYVNGICVYRKSILKDIQVKSSSLFFQAEILSKCLKNKYLYAEVPIGLSPRYSGESKAIKFNSFLRVARDYLQTLINYHVIERKKLKFEPDSKTLSRWDELKSNTRVKPVSQP